MTTPKDRYPSLARRYPTEDGAEARPGEEAIRRLAPSRATVLLVGGSKAAKAAFARALHDRSARVHRPFVSVDCGALDPDALEEVLFGCPSYEAPPSWSPEKAPPSATRDADRGTLYVATIESLPIVLQPRFLRFLDEAYTVRVIASCDADLAALARKGKFRHDLGERLLLVRVDLSGTRE
jgi:DNA-binding NtrC family response regulator